MPLRSCRGWSAHTCRHFLPDRALLAVPAPVAVLPPVQAQALRLPVKASSQTSNMPMTVPPPVAVPAPLPPHPVHAEAHPEAPCQSGSPTPGTLQGACSLAEMLRVTWAKTTLPLHNVGLPRGISRFELRPSSFLFMDRLQTTSMHASDLRCDNAAITKALRHVARTARYKVWVGNIVQDMEQADVTRQFAVAGTCRPQALVTSGSDGTLGC